MVKKLFKYEFMYYLKALLPYQIIIPITALLNRIIQLFETKTDIYGIVFGSSIFMFIASIVVSVIMAFVLAISRFYKNLFTSEGYLTMTLPVTENNHILVKLTTAVSFIFITVINILISLCIITSGDLLVEIIKAIDYLCKYLFNEVGFNLVFYIIEILTLVILSIFTNLLLYYACITIGQLAKKNRVLMSFVTYFIYYIITQIIGTIFIVFTMIFSIQLESLAIWFFETFTPYQIVHMGLCAGIIFSSVIAVVYFFISKIIIRKKLNLE